jgi:hypothetical protein
MERVVWTRTTVAEQANVDALKRKRGKKVGIACSSEIEEKLSPFFEPAT